MIKRERKDLNGNAIPVPNSLDNTQTIGLRDRLISNNSWLNQTQFKSQFKQNDTKLALDIFSDTCIFCQQKLTIATGNEDARSVEHFRPKSKYWWLAYSWDNLFPVCRACNQAKDNDFECSGTQITNIRSGDLANIHSLAADYQAIEQPKLLHPELDAPEIHLKYNLKGKIEDDSSIRGEYTINTCKLNRLDIQGKRKSIFDEFDTEIALILFDGSKSNLQKQNEIFRKYFDFQKDAQNDRTIFSGYKRYIFKHFLQDIVKDYLSQI